MNEKATAHVHSRKSVTAMAVVFALVLVTLATVLDSSRTPAAGDEVAVERPSLTISQPEHQSVVPAGQAIAVAAALSSPLGGSTAAHYHTFVDGDLVDMPPASVSPVKLEPGTHDLMMEYVTADHKSFDPPILATVQVKALNPKELREHLRAVRRNT